ncbi:hypothetical protein ACGFNX_38915 [Streptomyces sp. NPDC048723]|uniref:hypothetical protein n=1 Tax=unclassified Streptomyces TaxID=2593676 RepID=UPI000AF42CC3
MARRTRARIPHDKFVIASHEGEPEAVWTGSSHITENGIFGQSNVGHTVTDASVARRYRDYGARLVADPTPGPETGVEAPVPLIAGQWSDTYDDEPARDHQRRLLAGSP